jgi:PAS domain S-box-containing protein
MQKKDLYILMLEDEPLDAELIKAQLSLLEEYNCIVQWVADKQSYLDALQSNCPDIVLSDYKLPQYTGLEALHDLRSKQMIIPFIFVTGTIDEETAAGTIKAGAWDYVVKDRLFRLPLAIRGALQLKEERINKAEVAAKNRQLSMALEQSPVHIVISNTDNKIEYVNTKFTEVTGYTPEEVIGKDIRMLVPEAERDRFLNSLQKAFRFKDSWRAEMQSIKKDGSLFWEYISVSPLKNEHGDITHYISVKEDITRRKQMEQELIEARDKAERSDKLKDAFLQNLSHEIRTPLNAIVGFSEILFKEHNISPDIIESYTSIIKSSSNQLLSIVSDILTIARIQTGQETIVVKTVDINKLFDDLYVIFNPIIAGKNLQFIITKDSDDEALLINTDETKLIQILTNLLNNSIKFTHEGSVELKYEVKNGNLEFSVTDTGIGIAKEAQDLIFERFRQADISISASYGGTGLGLAISKSFAEMLGGNLRVESFPHRGSTFFVTIPYTMPKDKLVKENSKALIQTTRHITIVVAEDEIYNFQLIEAFLYSKNITLLHAKNGQEAVEFCRNNPDVDLVLMDIKMPELDGISAFEEIRKMRKNIPVIVQTAYALEQEKQQFLQKGFTDYISKPLIKEEFLRIINKILDKKK